MLRELVMHEKLHEIPGYRMITPEKEVVMTRKEMNDYIDEVFAKIAKEANEEES